jgi:hypothetical protein
MYLDFSEVQEIFPRISWNFSYPWFSAKIQEIILAQADKGVFRFSMSSRGSCDVVVGRTRLQYI